MTDLYEYLRSQFSNFEEAKSFMHRFYNEMEQEVPGYGCVSLRAMAHHVSLILEGKPEPSDEEWWNTPYSETKYGSDLYFSAI